MVHHIVLWNFRSELTDEEKKEAGLTIQRNLMDLKELVSGIVELEVKLNEIASSNKDIALISTFESIEALEAYQEHPVHAEAAKYIKGVTCDRACFDF